MLLCSFDIELCLFQDVALLLPSLISSPSVVGIVVAFIMVAESSSSCCCPIVNLGSPPS